MDNFKVLIKIYPFCFVPEYSALIYSSFLHTSHVICVLFTFDTLSQRRPLNRNMPASRLITGSVF